jgi:hypothetical protein
MMTMASSLAMVSPATAAPVSVVVAAPAIPAPPPVQPQKPPIKAENIQALAALQTEPANVLTAENRALISRYLSGDDTSTPAAAASTKLLQIPVHSEVKQQPDGSAITEGIFFEINYERGTWRKFRKRQKK